MSKKINVRSPFYLNLTEPTIPLPTFTCGIANILNLSIDQQGQINTPTLSYGIIDSITSSDAGFSNGKFATVSTATARNITIRVLIPSGFLNVADGYIDCVNVVTQPALVTSGPSPSCVSGPTTNGSIPAQTLDVDGDSTTIDLTSYFTQGSQAIAGYSIYNPSTVVNASVSGDTLTLSSNAIGGTTTVHVSAFDTATNSCTALQSISVTVNAPNQTFACSNNGIPAIQGGSIAQDGTITNPTGPANITAIKDTSGGSPITSHSANNTGSDRSVTLFFDLTAPAGYANAGATIECSSPFNQPAGLPTFDCEAANLSGQQISTKGVISSGKTSLGTISDWTPKSFSEVSSDTSRTVTFTVDVPSGYSNSGTISCPKTITQPASTPTCPSGGTFYISQGQASEASFCTGATSLTKEVVSTSGSFTTGKSICHNGSLYNGGGLYHAVATSEVTVGPNYGSFVIWVIDSNGIIQEIIEWNCNSGTTGNGAGAKL